MAGVFSQTAVGRNLFLPIKKLLIVMRKKKGKQNKSKRHKKSLSFSLDHKLNSLQNDLLSWINKKNKLDDLRNKRYEVLRQIDTYKQNPNAKPGFDPYLNSLLKRKDEFEKEISSLPTEDKIATQIILLKKEIDLAKTEKTKSPIPKNLEIKIEIEWDSVSFQDSYISIFHNGHWLERYPVNNSRKSINLIKSHYKFRNAPKLVLELQGRSIKRILNSEVLFYYIQFLNNSGTIFDKSLFGTIGSFATFVKPYYDKHLPKLLQTRCFTLLSKYTTIDLPIIPVAEIVKGINGQWVIHDSFLFPFKKKKKIIWVWESVEEFKATYVFETELKFDIELQKIFDYLTGETINKRQSLINSPRLKSFVNYVIRIKHDTFEKWKKEIRPYIV